MGVPSVVNAFLKIRELTDITSEELQKAAESMEVQPQYYMYKILYQFHYGLVEGVETSNENRLNYYRGIVNKFIELYPDVYSAEDAELYSKFALATYLYSVDGTKYIELELPTEILEMLGSEELNSGSLKWYIRETAKSYILRYYMYHKEYHDLMKPLISELLVTEDEYYELIQNLN